MTLEQGPHPAQLDVFADSGSIFHLTFGAALPFIPIPFREAAITAWTGYQVSQAATGESWQRTGGEFIELALGMAATALYLFLGGKH